MLYLNNCYRLGDSRTFLLKEIMLDCLINLRSSKRFSLEVNQRSVFKGIKSNHRYGFFWFKFLFHIIFYAKRVCLLTSAPESGCRMQFYRSEITGWTGSITFATLRRFIVFPYFLRFYSRLEDVSFYVFTRCPLKLDRQSIVFTLLQWNMSGVSSHWPQTVFQLSGRLVIIPKVCAESCSILAVLQVPPFPLKFRFTTPQKNWPPWVCKNLKHSQCPYS